MDSHMLGIYKLSKKLLHLEKKTVLALLGQGGNFLFQKKEEDYFIYTYIDKQMRWFVCQSMKSCRVGA